jgi:PQQ-dependent dehydrogenase (methanol/ethanol family)
MTMAPLVAKNRVLVGNSGGEYGVRGWIAALDARNGNIVWRAFSTGPDKDVLIGTHFQPFYAQDRGKDLGISTWPGEAWKIGGGAVWGFLSYDPEMDLVFYGTSNPSPWNPEQRPGDNKWTAGVFARELSTGEARWFYQMSPHDLHDYDGINENVLVEIALQGRTRKVIVHPDRNGYLYVFDRITGQVLTATPYAYITTSTGVDSGSGRLRYSASKQPREGTVIHELCPASPGAKDWQPSAYSPRTGWLYMPQNNLCQDAETDRTSYIRGTPFVGATLKMYPGPGGHRGEFNAWDPATGKQMWSVR